MGDRDALRAGDRSLRSEPLPKKRAEDYTFSASSRTTYMASLLGFGAVISDAAMIDRVIGMDVQEAAAARDQVPRRGYGAIGPPGRREVEGIGGRLWYELGV